MTESPEPSLHEILVFLLEASNQTIGEYILKRLSAAQNHKREARLLVEKAIEEMALARVAMILRDRGQMLRDHAEKPPEFKWLSDAAD